MTFDFDTSDYIEKTFLAQFLNIEDGRIVDIIEKVKPEYFSNNGYKALFEHFRAWCLDKNNCTTLPAELNRLLIEIKDECISTANYEYFMKQIIEHYKIEQEQKIKSLLDENKITIEEAIKKINELKKISSKNEAKDIVEDVFQAYYKGYECIKTNWNTLDDFTGGFHKGELIILAGASSMGKSVTMLNIAENVATSGKKTLIMSFEMKRNQLLNRLVCAKSGINASKFRNLSLSAAEEKLYEKTLREKILTLPLHIIDKPNMTIQDIKLEALKMQKTKGLDFLVIDYLGLIKPLKSLNSRYLEITELTRELKILACELDIPVLVLCQLNRSTAERQNKRPLLSDLRDSGSIEQDADIVMFVYRDEYYNPSTTDTGKIEIIIRKHRDGMLGSVKLNFNKWQQKIEEPFL